MRSPPLSVLFVEPDAVASRGLRRELRRRGAHVRATTRPSRALLLAADAIPDLVVLDDVFDGEGLVDALRIHAPEAEFIVLGATSVAAGRGLLMSAPRPTSDAMLVEVVEQAFPNRLTAAGLLPAEGASIVCVDDDPRYLRSISRFLAERGYRPHSYEQAPEALAALDVVQPALAIVDVMMPGMDGLDLAAEIRTRFRRRIPVMLLSGLARDEVSAEGRATGASLYLEKACDPGDLASAVEFFAGPGRESP